MLSSAEPEPTSLQQLEEWLGKEIEFEGVDEVSANDIRRKLEVYCFDCPIHYDELAAQAHGYRTVVAPAVMTPLWAMPAYWSPGDADPFAPGVPEKGGGIRMELPAPYLKAVNAASAWEYAAPLYPGDRLRGVWKLTEVKPRRTRLGDGVFLSYEATLWKATGELVAVNRNTTYRYNELPERVEAAKSKPREVEPAVDDATDSNPTVDWGRRLTFEDVAAGSEFPPYHLRLNYQRIVMSVAADRMFSGIHHNRDYARAAGLDDIILNTRGYEMVYEITLRRWMGIDGRLSKLGPFRMTRNSHPGDALTCRGRVQDLEIRGNEGLVRLDIWVESHRGELARGEAVVLLPMRAHVAK